MIQPMRTICDHSGVTGVVTSIFWVLPCCKDKKISAKMIHRTGNLFFLNSESAGRKLALLKVLYA